MRRTCHTLPWPERALRRGRGGCVPGTPLRATWGNGLTHYNPGVRIWIFGKVFCYLSLVSSCCIFQFVTLMMIVSLIKYFNVKKSLFTSTAIAFGCEFKNVQTVYAVNNKIF